MEGFIVLLGAATVGSWVVTGPNLRAVALLLAVPFIFGLFAAFVTLTVVTTQGALRWMHVRTLAARERE